MVSPMIESAVQLKHLVQSMKVTVTMTMNAKEALSVGKTIVLDVFHLTQIAVNPADWAEKNKYSQAKDRK